VLKGDENAAVDDFELKGSQGAFYTFWNGHLTLNPNTEQESITFTSCESDKKTTLAAFIASFVAPYTSNQR
jgi:hypothetical protein